MKRAVFITGFANWGKSTIITELFGGRTRFLHGYPYRVSGVNFATLFTVQSQSNDDVWGQDYVRKVTDRINGAPSNIPDLISALCPTLDGDNNFVNILSAPPFDRYDRLYVFLIEYKWEHHAQLMINNIQTSGQGIPNVQFVVINADRNLTNDIQRGQAKMNQIRAELNQIFP